MNIGVTLKKWKCKKLIINAKKVYILFFILFFPLQMMATHNRAGEITYKQIGPLTFEITLITFTDPTTLAHQQRTELYFIFSDNTQDTFPRISETLAGINISKNEYSGVHTFPAVGTYIIAMEDPNRNAGGCKYSKLGGCFFLFRKYFDDKSANWK